MSFCTGNKPNLEGCLCLCGLKLKPRKGSRPPPNHLKNWEIWLERRRKMHTRLMEKLARLPGDLVMNSGEVCRSIREEQLIIDYTKIETNFDKYRGNPDFWIMPTSMKAQSSPFKETEYYAVKTKPEKNEVPEIESVGVPDFIFKEKYLLPRTRCFKTMWNRNTYRKKIIDEVFDKLLEIQPHKSDISNLIVLGSTSPPKEEQNQVEDFITIDSDSVKSEISSSISSDYSDSVELPRIKINNRELTGDNQFSKNEYKLTVMFQYSIGQIVPTRNSIILENISSVTIRVYWTEHKKFKLFREFTETSNIFHPFKFDKTELIMLPHTKIEMPIYFKVDKPGNFVETWQITTRPRIWHAFCVLVQFKGFSHISNFDQKVKDLEEKLQQNIRNTCIKELLNDIISDGVYTQPTKPLSYIVSEKEQFENENLKMKTGIFAPQYVYNNLLINKLREFYQEVRSVDDPINWNLSLNGLMALARKKDLIVYCENKLELYKKAKEQRKQIQETVVDKTKAKTKETKQKKKSDTGDDLMDKSASQLTYYQTFCSLSGKLEKPSIHINHERQKYFFCYIALRTLFLKMQNSLDPGTIAENVVKKENRSPPVLNPDIFSATNQLYYIPERQVYETFEETYILRMKRFPRILDAFKAKPKPLSLKQIDSADVKKIFKVYFAKEEDSPKGKKTASSDKDVKKSAKDGKDKDELNQLLNVDFDPYYENPRKSSIVNPSSHSESLYEKMKEISETVQKTQLSYEDKYLIVYSTLCEAVDVLVDSIETFNQKPLPTGTLAELNKCQIQPRKDDLRGSTTESDPLRTQSEIDYFTLLLQQQHEGNIRKNYFETTKVDNQRLDNTNHTLENVFSLTEFTPKPIPYCLKNREAQTDASIFLNNKVQESQNDLLDKEAWIITDSSSDESRNIFYFMDFAESEKFSNSIRQ